MFASVLSAKLAMPSMLFALKCSTRFAVFTIPPEELLDEELLLDDELELPDELDEELPLDDELELPDELDEELPLDDDELLDEEITQVGILHSCVVLLWQQGILFVGHVNVSLVMQFGTSPEEQYPPLVHDGTIQFGVLACPITELFVMQ